MWKSVESKSECAAHAQANDHPAGLDDGGVGKATAQIPGKVAETVQGVVGERKGESGLEQDLGSDGESAHGSHHGGRLQVPAEDGRGEVCGSPQVERAGEDNAGDTVQGTADPADLGLVDGKVGGHRAIQALLSQDLSWVFGVRGRGDGSG